MPPMSPGDGASDLPAFTAAEVRVWFPKGKLPANQQTCPAPRGAPLGSDPAGREWLPPGAGGRRWCPQGARVQSQRNAGLPEEARTCLRSALGGGLHSPASAGGLPHRAGLRLAKEEGHPERAGCRQDKTLPSPPEQPGQERVHAPFPRAGRWVLGAPEGAEQCGHVPWARLPGERQERVSLWDGFVRALSGEKGGPLGPGNIGWPGTGYPSGAQTSANLWDAPGLSPDTGAFSYLLSSEPSGSQPHPPYCRTQPEEGLSSRSCPGMSSPAPGQLPSPCSCAVASLPLPPAPWPSAPPALPQPSGCL